MHAVSEQIPARHLEIVRRVMEFIEGRLREGLAVASIARAAGMSRSHLCRTFKQVTGVSVKRFLTRRRLQLAKALLRQRAMTIRQVAWEVGYRDLGHFDRVFRRSEGQTPSRYRRQIMA